MAAPSLTEQEKKEWRKERKALIPIFLPQLVLSVVVTVSVLYGGYYHCPSIPVPPSNDLGDKLTFYIKCCVVPCAVLHFLAIMGVINKRVTSPAANPLAGKEHLLVVDKNFLTNTLEQIQLFLMVSLILTSYLDASEMRIIPVYTLLWVAGRVLFRIGYGIDPRYRSFGILIAMQSSGILIAVIFYLIYTRGFLSSSGVGTGGQLPSSQSDEL